MRFSQFVAPGAIVPKLSTNTRDAVIAELVDALLAAGAFRADLRDDLLAGLIQRERVAGTGFGKGIALPHVKHKAITTMAAAIGLSPTGIDFSSIDKQPVYSVFLLLSPLDKPEDHLQAMTVIFKNISNETFRRFLRQATTLEEIQTLLDEADSQHIGV